MNWPDAFRNVKNKEHDTHSGKVNPSKTYIETIASPSVPGRCDTCGNL